MSNATPPVALFSPGSLPGEDSGVSVAAAAVPASETEFRSLFDSLSTAEGHGGGAGTGSTSPDPDSIVDERSTEPKSEVPSDPDAAKPLPRLPEIVLEVSGQDSATEVAAESRALPGHLTTSPEGEASAEPAVPPRPASGSTPNPDLDSRWVGRENLVTDRSGPGLLPTGQPPPTESGGADAVTPTEDLAGPAALTRTEDLGSRPGSEGSAEPVPSAGSDDAAQEVAPSLEESEAVAPGRDEDADKSVEVANEDESLDAPVRRDPVDPPRAQPRSHDGSTQSDDAQNDTRVDRARDVVADPRPPRGVDTNPAQPAPPARDVSGTGHIAPCQPGFVTRGWCQCHRWRRAAVLWNHVTAVPHHRAWPRRVVDPGRWSRARRTEAASRHGASRRGWTVHPRVAGATRRPRGTAGSGPSGRHRARGASSSACRASARGRSGSGSDGQCDWPNRDICAGGFDGLCHAGAEGSRSPSASGWHSGGE